MGAIGPDRQGNPGTPDQKNRNEHPLVDEVRNHLQSLEHQLGLDNQFAQSALGEHFLSSPTSPFSTYSGTDVELYKHARLVALDILNDVYPEDQRKGWDGRRRTSIYNAATKRLDTLSAEELAALLAYEGLEQIRDIEQRGVIFTKDKTYSTQTSVQTDFQFIFNQKHQREGIQIDIIGSSYGQAYWGPDTNFGGHPPHDPKRVVNGMLRVTFNQEGVLHTDTQPLQILN